MESPNLTYLHVGGCSVSIMGVSRYGTSPRCTSGVWLDVPLGN
jgi:hypothetical protein